MKDPYLNAILCRTCGGKCCKQMPGANFPSDFGEDLYNNLLKALSSGNYAIDWWEADESIYFIRPRIQGINTICDPSWGGECIFLKNVCSLEPKDRPHNCRNLEPGVEKCISHDGSKRGAADAWIPYQDTIKKILNKLDN